MSIFGPTWNDILEVTKDNQELQIRIRDLQHELSTTKGELGKFKDRGTTRITFRDGHTQDIEDIGPGRTYQNWYFIDTVDGGTYQCNALDVAEIGRTPK